ncbi:MAG: hypothetical protein IJD60_07565 [Clostridia bacterium]|nr:hypothetical protein [Clostridia bacterium]
MPYTSIDEEEQLRRQLEAERKAREEAAKAEREAAEQTEKAQKEAAEATAAAEEQAKAAQEQTNEQTNETAQGTASLDPAAPINPAAPETPDPVYTGVRSGGMGRITSQDKLNAQFMREEREAIQDTRFKVSAYDTAEGYDQSKNKAHMTSMLVGHAADLPTEEESGNKVFIDYRSVRNKEQAYALMMVYSDDAAKVKGGKKLASALGMDFESFLAEAENYMYDKYGRNVFSSPYSSAAKNRAYVAGVQSIGLTGVDGQVLDPYKMTTADMMLAGRMDPSGETADALYELAKAGSKIPGNIWYGQNVTKDMFQFVDSADLTMEDYKARIAEINETFTYSNVKGASNPNVAALAELYGEIKDVYSDNSRVMGYYLRDLKKSFTDHTGLEAPPDELLDKILADTAEARDAARNETDDLEEGKKGAIDAIKEFLFGAPDAAGDMKEAEPEAEKPETKTVEQIMEELEGEKASGGGGSSTMASGGTAKVNGQELPVSAPIASTSMPSRQDLFGEDTAVDSGMQAESNPLGLSEELLNRSRKGEAVGPVYNQAANIESIPYNAEMTDEQAWAAYRAGYRLAPENYSQISRYANAEFSGLMTNQKAVESGDPHVFRKHGSILGATAQAIASSGLTGEARGSAELALMSLAADIYDMWTDPQTKMSRPAGSNMYDYAFSLDPSLVDRNAAIMDSLKTAKGAYSENVVQTAEERQARMDGYAQSVLSGHGDAHMADALAEHYAQDWVDVDADSKRNELIDAMSPLGGYFGEDGTFWQGGSLAAQEGQNIRIAGGMQGFYDFQNDLYMRTVDLLDGYTTAAHNIGTTLDKYLESANIGSLDQIVDIAYSSIQAEGNAIVADKGLQEAANAAAQAPQSTGDIVFGTNRLTTGDALKHSVNTAWTDYLDGFAHASYVMVDQATHSTTVQAIADDYRDKYGWQAEMMYRRDLNAVLDSGALSDDMAAELRMNMGRAYSIFDVGYEIDATGLKGILRQTSAELNKKLDILNTVTATLEPDQQRLIQIASGAAGNLIGMGVSTLTAGAGRALGVAGQVANAVGSAAGFGMSIFDDAYNNNVHEKGMTSGTAAKAALLETIGMTAIENFNTGSITDMFFGGASIEGVAKAARKSPANFARAMGGLWLSNAASEGGEEALQTGAEHLFDILDEEWLAYERGEKFSLARTLGTMERGLKATDYTALGKEMLNSYGAGMAYGAVFGLAGMATTGRMAFKDARAFGKYESVNLATQITEGDLEANNENLGKVHAALQKDLQDPAFRRYIDKGSMQAMQSRQVMTAMLEGTMMDTLDTATTHALKAKEYEEKATAAGKAVNASKSDYMSLRELVASGQLDKKAALESAQNRWAKAQTTYTEAQHAADKERNTAAKNVKAWLEGCKERGAVLASEGMQVRMEQIANVRMGIAKRLETLYNATENSRTEYEAILADNERSDALAQREIDYAEGAVFGEADEIDEELSVMDDAELDADIEGLTAQIAEAEARIADISSRQEELGIDGETIQAMTEQELAPLANRKEHIIAREKSRFNDAFDRMQQALEMDNEDAADQIQAEYDGIAARLQSLGVDADALTMEQYGIAPEEADAAYDEAQVKEAQRAEDEQYGKLTDDLSRRMESTNAGLEAINPARWYFARNPIYVNESQAADILSAEGLKSISQFNRRYGTKLTTKEADGAMPLDGHVLSDIGAEAAGSVNVDGDPVAEILTVLQRGKELTAAQKAEKAEARELEAERKRVESARRERVKDVATGTTKEQRDAQKAEAQAQANVDAMDAEAFIEEKYPNATDEQKAEIRKRFASGAQKAGEAMKDAAAFAARVAKKFKVAIKFVDSLDGAEGEYDGKSILIARDATQGDVIRKVILHELTHRAEGSKLYGKLSGMILDMKYGGDQARMDADIASTISRYQAFYDKKGRKDKFTEANAKQEIVADFMGEMLDGNQEMVDRLVADEPSVAQKIVDAIKGAIDKLRGVKGPELDKIRKAERMFERALKKAKKGDGKSHYSIGWTKNGKRYVEVEEDILDGLPENEWAKAARDALRKFSSGIPVGNNIIKVSQKTYGEWMHSKDAMRMKRADSETYGDKMRAANNADEIIWASTNYVNEDAVHSGANGMKDFGRGKVLMSIGGRDYQADVLVGLKENGELLLYDVTYIEPTEIQKKKSQNSSSSRESVPTSQPVTSNTIVQQNADGVKNQDMQREVGKFSLPSGDALDAEIRAWRAGHQAQIDAALTNDGVSQFAEKTVQHAVSLPVQVKKEFQTNPLLRNYAKDTNAAQLERAMGNIERDGYEAEVNRLLDAETFSAEDTVEAGAIAISAFEAGDVSTGLEMALKYRTVGTEQAQAMQSRKMFAGMSPTHIKLKVAGEAEQMLSDFIEGHQPKAKEVDTRAKAADDLIRDMQGGDESARVMEGGDYTIDVSNSKWGLPINEKQKALIDHYKLNNVARPGLYYNRATTKQRMLEAILATPDPDANSGNGLTLTQRLEWMKEGKAVVTQADLDYIADQIRQYSAMPDTDQATRAGDLALARAFEAYGNIKQPTKLEKARTWRYVSMLLSLPSAERNVIGNSVMNAVNAATHDTVGVFADWVTSLFTGQRTAANISFGERAEGWNAWADETANTFRDYFMDKADVTPSAQGEDRFNKNQRGRVYQTQAFEDVRLVEGFLMSVGDRNFWKKAYVNSLAEQQRVADMNGVELNYDKACEIAKAEANYATFNEDNFLRNWLSEARKNPYVGFVLDMVMPFTGVPTNITKRMVEYSPIGMAMTFLKHGGRAMAGANFDQRSFVEGISRGLSGTALWMIGMGLGQLGAINLGTGGEDDEKVYNLKASLGEQYSPFVRIGDENISLAAFAPAISPIIMGATAYDILKESDDKVQAFTNALTSSLDQIFDASYMSGLADLFDRNGTIAENAMNTLATNLISQNVPAFMTQIATAMDPYVRDTKDANAIVQAVKNGLIARIPGARGQYLNEKTDITGQAFESKEGIRNFIDPFTTTKVNDDPALIELDRLYDELGSSTHIPSYLVKTSGKVTVLAKIADDRRVNMDRSAGENKLTLTANERNHYNRLYSALCFEGTGDVQYQKIGKVDTKFEGIRDVMASRKYQRASDEEKAEMISDVIAKAKLLTQTQMVIDKGYVY